MRSRGAVKVKLAGLLVGGLIASLAAPADARPAPDSAPVAKRAPSLSVRVAAPQVAVSEPAVLVARTKPAVAGATIEAQRLVEGDWSPVGKALTDRQGQAVIALDTSIAGPQTLRAVRPTPPAPRRARRTVSATTTLTVLSGTSCTPRIALVDTQADATVRCLAARLDRWRSAGLMGIGQQLNVSSQDYADPLVHLEGRRVSVVGFDLEELALTATYEWPFLDRALADLIALGRQGVVLTASWHPPNPRTQGRYDDRRWTALERILDETTPEGMRFWADFDAKLELLGLLQEAGVAVVFRPLHEANGDWFWWGRPKPATYRKLWQRMQKRAWRAEVHNLLWAYSFNANTGKHITSPVELLPRRVDLAGIDSYDPEVGAPRDRLSMKGYAAVAKKVKRMAITEAGPYDSLDGKWRPRTLEKAANAQQRKPLWAMLWFDDASGYKQLASLQGGTAWLDSCPNAFCLLR